MVVIFSILCDKHNMLVAFVTSLESSSHMLMCISILLLIN